MFSISLESVLKDYTKFHNDNFTKIFAEPFSILLAWLLLNFTGLTPNQVTLLGFMIGICGALAGLLFGPLYAILGYLLFYIFDLTDGKIARAKSLCGPRGKRLGRLANRAVFVSTSFVLMYRHTTQHETINALTLMAFTLTYYYVDILDYTSQVMHYTLGKPPQKSVREYILKEVLRDWNYWMPSKLSCPWFILLGYLLFGSPAVGYFCGILAILLRLGVWRLQSALNLLPKPVVSTQAKAH